MVKVKYLANVLEEVNCGHFKDIVVYYVVKYLPNHYDVLKMHMSYLLSYDDLEVKLLKEDIFLS